MVAFNFQPQFAPLILSGKKRHTFRLTKRCAPGEMMQIFTGQRTKACKLLIEAKCLHVAETAIFPHCVYTGPYVFTLAASNVVNLKNYCWPPSIHGATRLPLDNFARADGFKSHDEMIEFFSDKYADKWPLKGWLHVWEPPPRRVLKGKDAAIHIKMERRHGTQ